MGLVCVQATIMEHTQCSAEEMGTLSLRDQLQFTALGSALEAEMAGGAH